MQNNTDTDLEQLVEEQTEDNAEDSVVSVRNLNNNTQSNSNPARESSDGSTSKQLRVSKHVRCRMNLACIITLLGFCASGISVAFGIKNLASAQINLTSSNSTKISGNSNLNNSTTSDTNTSIVGVALLAIGCLGFYLSIVSCNFFCTCLEPETLLTYDKSRPKESIEAKQGNSPVTTQV